ncbi:MAG: DUF177 domain-containing protein [Acidobacteriota bacterium]
MSGLLLDVRRLREARDHVERSWDAAALDADPAICRPRGRVELAFDIHKDGQQFRLVGRVAGALGLACSRCLEEYELEVDERFDVVCLPASENAGEGEREIEEDDLTTAYYRDQTIDLGQLVVEQFYLAVPMKPLCRDDCRGLCPECGINLNSGACSCAHRWVDPRLAGLRDVLKKD